MGGHELGVHSNELGRVVRVADPNVQLVGGVGAGLDGAVWGALLPVPMVEQQLELVAPALDHDGLGEVVLRGDCPGRAVGHALDVVERGGTDVVAGHFTDGARGGVDVGLVLICHLRAAHPLVGARDALPRRRRRRRNTGGHNSARSQAGGNDTGGQDSRHGCSPSMRRTMAVVTAPGASRGGMWPESGSTCMYARGQIRWSTSDWDTGVTLSRSPTRI